MIIITIKNPNITGYFAYDNEGKFPKGKGGLRCTPDVSAEEIERLAEVMTKKINHYKLPYTGAKSGIVWNGKGGRKRKQKLIKEFFTELNRLNIFPRLYISAPDLGVDVHDIDFIIKHFGKGSATRGSKGIKHSSGLTGWGIALITLKTIQEMRKSGTFDK